MGNRRDVGGRRKSELDGPTTSEAAPDRVGASAADYLDYIADMLQELKAMSVQAGRPALTALLERACQEAAKGRRTG
jgi:hypothetical protein